MLQFNYQLLQLRNKQRVGIIELDDEQFLGKFHVATLLPWWIKSNTMTCQKIENSYKHMKEVKLEYEESNDENFQIYQIEEQIKLYRIDF
jgi:hypothetical protein